VRSSGRDAVEMSWKALGDIESSALWAAVWGFLLRAGAILALHTYRFRVTEDHFAFGYEIGRIARAITLGQGFSNPFSGITGPTAWEAPLYPYLLAGVFKLTGIYTTSSAILILTINSLFSALTVLPVYLIARKVFGSRIARWAAWTWALYPYAIYWATKWVWETSLTALLLTTAFWLTLELRDALGARVWRLWLWFGCVWGAIALTNPSCLAFLPFAGVWACLRLRRRGQSWFLPATASALVFLALVTPWEVRNYLVFNKIMPIRSNAGAELRFGNDPSSTGVFLIWLHPTQNPLELQKYVSAGEVGYVAMRMREAVDFIRSHPGRTAVLCLKKAAYFWAGEPKEPNAPLLDFVKNLPFLATSLLAWWGLALAVKHRNQGAVLFSALLLIYPVTYYICFPHTRYRHPIEPVMMLLILYLISQAPDVSSSETSQSSSC
jgi:4-amino-4-deoxy-L-arabinose transferase-like glycosyltransferase